MELYDIAVVGGGPAGLSAALTGCIRGKKVVLFDAGEFGGKLRKAAHIENYLGIPTASGNSLMDSFYEHLRTFEPTVVREKVAQIFPGEEHTIVTAHAVYRAKTVILATGISTAKVLPGEKEFLGRGVSYCATCDGNFYKDKSVAVCLYAAAEKSEVEFLADIAKVVYVLPLYQGAEASDFNRVNIEVINDKPVKISKNEQGMILSLAKADGLLVDGIFCLRDIEPLDSLIENLAVEKNIVAVTRGQETNIAGIFAAGDITGMPLQITKATGEGQVAAFSAVTFLQVGSTNKV